MNTTILFKCPTCGAEHSRGFLDGVSLFRCLRCGYQGHGFHPDADIDRAVYKERQLGNLVNRAAGVPEVPMGVDPRDFTS